MSGSADVETVVVVGSRVPVYSRAMATDVALLLDLDGVLIDSWPVAQRAIERAVAEVCPPGTPSPIDAFRALRGQPLPDIAAQLQLPASFVDAFCRHSRDMATMIPVYPGVEEALRHIKSAGISLGLITGKDRVRTVELLDQLGLSCLFDAVVTADDAPGKPSPEALLTCIRRIPSLRAIGYVGDTPCDMATARSAGVRSILATWDADATGEADSIVKTPDELQHLAIRLSAQTP
jgi:phosphoglycolate phosphatase-like HAD superfamily hydrolase